MIQFGKSLLSRLFTGVKGTDTNNYSGVIVLTLALFMLSRGRGGGAGGAANETEMYILLRNRRTISSGFSEAVSRGFSEAFESLNPSGGELVQTRSVVEVVSPTEQVGVEISLDPGGSSASMDVSQNEEVDTPDRWDQLSALLTQESGNPILRELAETATNLREVVSPTEQVGVEISLDPVASPEASSSRAVSQNEWVLARKKELLSSLWEHYKARHHQIDDDVFSLIATRWPEFYHGYYNPLYSARSFQGSWTATNSSYNLLYSYSDDENSEMPVPTRPRYKGSATVFIPKLLEFYLCSRWNTGNERENGTLDSLDSFELKLEEEAQNLAHQTLEREDSKERLLSDYRHDLCKVGSKLCLKQFDLSIRKSKNRDLREARPVYGVRWDVEVTRISTAITDLHRIRVAIARLTLYISKKG